MLTSLNCIVFRKLKLIKKRILDTFWGKLAANIIKAFGQSNAGDMAASIAYYAFLSMFPLLLGLIAILGIFLPSEMVQNQLIAFFQHHLPTSVGILKENISRVIELRGALGVLSLVGLFWAGSAIFNAIGRVIRQAWNIQKRRPFYLRKLIDLTMALGTSIMFLLSMALTTVFLVLPELEIQPGHIFILLISKLLSFVIIFITFLLIYKYLPNTKTKWRNVWPGALLAAFLFELARSLFSLYIIQFANYEMVYGSVASIIALLVWIYLSAFILIIGAKFCSEYIKLKNNSDSSRK